MHLKGCPAPQRSLGPFEVGLQPVESFWCLFWRRHHEFAFSPLKGACCTTLPGRWLILARPASRSLERGWLGGVIPDPCFPQLFSPAFFTQERDVEEASAVPGRFLLFPPDRNDKRGVVREFSYRGYCLDSSSPLLHGLGDQEFVDPGHCWGCPPASVIKGELFLGKLSKAVQAPNVRQPIFERHEMPRGRLLPVHLL